MKQGKYEMDRLKQAEKKKIRLEKALATSAAIRSELEKKKQIKKEEQQNFLHARRTSMDNLTCKSPPVLRKVKKKKKQGRYEMYRLEQAEKKKRRLEKTLAMSAAIRSELEKKKQKKKEEQQRLDEEEDNDCMFEDATCWNNHAEFLMRGRQETHGEFEGNFTDLPCSSGACVEEGCGLSRTELCPGLLAAQAVSSLQIRDDANLNTFFVDRVRRG